jgi:hypothetical protein
MTLAGLITIRNGLDLDYCFRECAQSLLGICDELVVNDVSSTDGTWEEVQFWADHDSRITLCRTDWTDPRATADWWPEVLNRTRQHAKSSHVLHLDADELIHENDYYEIRRVAEEGKSVFLHRYNFWRDAKSLIPEGVCCGTKVLRMAPKDMPLPSDYPYGPAEETMKIAVESGIKCYHYGFLRKRDAFFRKAREVQRIWANDFDPRLAAAEKSGVQNWMTHDGVVPWKDDLAPFTGTHPKSIHQWLTDRGYTV